VRIIGVLGLVIPLAGCAIAEKVVARHDYQRAADDYKQCTTANATAPQQCEEKRLAMEAAERKQNSISTDIDIKPTTPPPDYAAAR